jgi:hypothetical protein
MWTEGNMGYRSDVGHPADLFATGHLPQECAFFTSGRQVLAIRAEGKRLNIFLRL